MRGRKPLPAIIKKQRGTLEGKDSSLEEATYEQLTKVSIPKVLVTKRAREIFRDKSKQLIAQGILQAPDIDQLTAYSNTFDLYLQAVEEQNKEENKLLVSVKTKSGEMQMISPYIKLQQQLLPLINSIGSNYGFSPSSRARIAKPGNMGIEDKDFS